MSVMNGSEHFERNPYAAPSINTSYVNPNERSVLFVDGDCIVITSGASLPERCIRTNEPTHEEDRFSTTLEWSRPFRLVLTRDKCHFTYFETKSIRRQRYVGLIIYGVVLLGLSLLFWFPLILIGLIGLPSLIRGSMNIAYHQDGMFWIRGFGPEFVKTCRDEFGVKPDTLHSLFQAKPISN
jgi:hypothetical protein